VVALSQHFGLTNRLASLLVLETDREYVEYHLEKERLSVAEVESAAQDALEHSAATESGLDLSMLPPEALAVIAALPNAPKTDPLAHLELAPRAGGSERALAEETHRAARQKTPEDLLVFYDLSGARHRAGDLLGAARAISSVVELRPMDPEALRLAGFVLIGQGLYQPAAEVLGRLRATRSFEVQVYMEEATALLETGRLADAARNYEIVLARHWDRHQQEAEAGRQQYAQLLARVLQSSALDANSRPLVERRLAALGGRQERTDLQYTIHWSVDDIDIDLWVTGPDGEKCFYSNPATRSGGRLFWDTTTGYGPELFQQARADRGRWLAQVHYFSNNSVQWAIPSVVLGIEDASPFDASRHQRRYSVQLLARQRDSVSDLFHAQL
jgi:tetratricopeptide (TPR) repeat protein